MRVLLVEDEQAIAFAVRRTFEREGIALVCASDVSEALEMLDSSDFDVAILDRSLPDGSGLQVIDAIAGSSRHASAHILMLSGAGAELDRVEALERGADDYVVKPFSMAELVARVLAVGRRQTVAAGRSQVDGFDRTARPTRRHGPSVHRQRHGRRSPVEAPTDTADVDAGSAALRHAMATGGIEVHHQPVIDLRDHRTVGTEALVRWRHPDGVLAAGDFVPAAERSGDILDLGRLVLAGACEQTAHWRADGHDVSVAVNISAVQLADDDLVRDVERSLARSGLPPTALWLEVTETSLVRDLDHAKEVLHVLADRGVRMAIDDFGTGWASLTYLHSFPIHALKIDRTFVTDIETSREDLAIARSILALGGELGLQVIAEGIETEAQDAVLRDLGCQMGQGYLYGRPTPVDQVRIDCAREMRP